MKQTDLILLFVGALIPFAINMGLITSPIFDSFHLLYLGVVFVYFMLKFFRHYNYTFSKATLFRLSKGVDQRDILVVGLWGLTLYQHFEINFAVFTMWLLTGLMATAITFFPNILISEILGIKTKKGGEWQSWEGIDTIVFNEVCFAYVLQDQSGKIPIINSTISKNKLNKLSEVLHAMSEYHNIPIAEQHETLVVLADHADFSHEDGTLDDFVGSVGDFTIFTPNHILGSNFLRPITWQQVAIEKNDIGVLLKYHEEGSEFAFFKKDYKPEEWEAFEQFLKRY